MLTQSDVQLAIKSLKLYSSLGFYPIGIQNDGLPNATSPQRRSKATSPGRRIKAWRYLLATSVLYIIFVAARLGRTIGSEVPHDQALRGIHVLPLHAIMLVGGLAAIVTFILLWHSSRLWLNVCLLRDLLSGLPQEIGPNWNNIMVRGVPLFYPVIGFCLEAAKWATVNTPAYSLRSVMPPLSIITAPAHGMCALIEVILLAYWISVGFYALFIQLLFFQRCHDDLTNWVRSLRRKEHVTTYTIGKYYGQLRKIQIRVLYFNRTCSMIAYALKLLCLSECIVGIFFCIKLSRDHHFIGIVSGVSGGMMWYCYTVLYNRGFKLPGMVYTCQAELLERSRTMPKYERMTLKRQVKSLGRVEVSMGGFHALERSSTILFFDFVLVNICSLIITFPGQL